MGFRTFTKKHFEFKMYQMKLGRVDDITDEWIAEGNHSWEHIYSVSTQNKAVDIIIFSSVDIRKSATREYASDSVKLVLRWKTKNGYMYKGIKHHYRMDNLFNHMANSIRRAQGEAFSLVYKEFTPNIEEAMVKGA